MVGIINWLKGYLRIRVSGLSVERFMNLCGYKNIILWDVCRSAEYYEMCISLKAFRQLRPIVRKTGTKAAILERKGLPFFISKGSKRKLFLSACIFTVFFWYVSSGFVWRIEIEGNYRITEEQLFDYLKQEDISVGMQKKNLDIEQLEKKIRIVFPDIIWTSGKFEGTTFQLAIRESNGMKVVETNETDTGYDLIAPVEGDVYSIIVRSGVPLVRQGDAVTENMILVEGRIPVKNDDGTIREYLYVKADADVYIRHSIVYRESLPASYIMKNYTGRKKTYPYIRIGEYELAYPVSEPFLYYDVLIRETTPEVIEQLKIPLLWGYFTYREYQNKECLYTKEQAVDILQKKFSQFIISLEEKGVQIIEKDVKIVKKSDIWEASGEIVVAEPAETLVETQMSQIQQALEN